MKKLVMVIVLGLAGLLAYNYATTGQWTLIPGGNLSAAEQQLRELEDELAAVRKQAGQAHRVASLSGTDMTADVEAARRALARLDKSLVELRKRLDSDSARKRAGRLAGDIAAFREEMR